MYTHMHMYLHMSLISYFFFFFFQLKRKPRAFPKLSIKRKVERIDDFKFEDFEIIGYKPHPTIKMEMAV